MPPEHLPAWHGLNVVVLSPTPTWPLNAGNRRRVFHLTQAMREQGARIIFVHYPSENEWRDGVPSGAAAAMSAQWDEHYTVPVTRPLHTQAESQDHTADEWWDRAIGDMLDWVFRTHAVDVLVVNYTWLTRAFAHCPRGVLRVLDTHDRFSGRRELLASAGIGPEFFHTTEAEERLALSRADVVWSIKPQEAVFFRSLGIRHVVNMPFHEPVDVSPARPPGAIIRFGLVGAANNINLVNVNAYLAAIRAFVSRTLLPCEIVVAGSICDLLPDAPEPWIDLLGRLPDLSGFYADVDVVVAPMAVSTGLKIKVGEALCHGKAVVALAHAFEGYPARHPFHTLPSMDAMMAACREIVNRPALVDELAGLSVVIARDIAAEIARGFAETIERFDHVPPGLCIVLPLAAVFDGSLALDHALETAHYLTHLTEVSMFIDGGAAAQGWDTAPFHLLAGFHRLVLAPHRAQAATVARLRAMGLGRPGVLPLAEAMRQKHVAVWFTAATSSWAHEEARLPSRAYFNLDTALLSGDEAGAAAMLSRLTRRFREVVTVSRRGLGGLHGERTHRVPSLWRGNRGTALARLRAAPRDQIVILADSHDDPLLDFTRAVVARLSPVPVLVVAADETARARCFTDGGMRPALVIDISSAPALEGVREMIDRAAVPSITLFSGTTLLDSALLLGEFLASPAKAAALVAERAQAGDYRNDAGWALIWAEIGELSSQADKAAA